MKLLALSGKEKKKKQRSAARTMEEKSVWVIQVLSGQVNCSFLTASLHRVGTHIPKSNLPSRVECVMWGKFREVGRHTQRKKTKAFIF